MDIKKYMDNEGISSVRDKDYGGYFYIFKNGKFVKRCKNQGLAIHALVGAFLSNTSLSATLNGFTANFSPSDYNADANYLLTTSISGANNYYIIVPSITLNTGSNHAASNPPTVNVASDYTYLNVIMDFGIIGSGASITQINIYLGSSQGSQNVPLFLSNVNIPFNSSAALTITWQLVL